MAEQYRRPGGVDQEIEYADEPKKFTGYRSPFGSKETPSINIKKEISRSPGILGDPEGVVEVKKEISRSPAVVGEPEDVVDVKPEFKGWRKPAFGVEDPIEEEFKGYRKPAFGVEDSPEQEEKVPSYVLAERDQKERDFVNFFGKNIYNGSKEAKKRAEFIEKRAPAKVEDNSQFADMEKAFGDDKWKANKSKKESDEPGSSYWGDAWQGFKASYSDVGNTFRQIYNYVSGDEEMLKKLQNDAAEIQSKFDSTSGRVGYLVGALSQSIPLMLLPTGATQVAGGAKLAQLGKMLANPSISKMAGIGALQTALSSPSTSGMGSEGFLADKAIQAGLGAGAGALGGLVGKGISAITRPSATKVGAKSMTEMAKEAEKMGFQLTPGQVSQNRFLQSLEEGLTTQPGSASVMEEVAKKNRRAFQKLVVREIDPGSTIEAPTTDFLNKAWKKAELPFEELRAVDNIQLDKTFRDNLKGIQKKVSDITIGDPIVSEKMAPFLNKYKKSVKVPEDTKLMTLADDMAKAGETEVAKDFRNLAKAHTIVEEMDTANMSGNDLVSSTKAIRKLAKESRDDAKLYLNQIANELEEGAERNLSFRGKGDMVKNLQNARTQMAKISRIKGAITNPMTGEVSPDKLFSASLKGDINKAGKGGKDLLPDTNMIAEIARQTKPFYVGKSPTAEKITGAELAKILSRGAITPILGAGIGGATGGEGGALTGLGVGILGSKALSKVLTSKTVMKNIVEGLPNANKLSPLIERLLPYIGSQGAKTNAR